MTSLCFVFCSKAPVCLWSVSLCWPRDQRWQDVTLSLAISKLLHWTPNVWDMQIHICPTGNTQISFTLQNNFADHLEFQGETDLGLNFTKAAKNERWGPKTSESEINNTFQHNVFLFKIISMIAKISWSIKDQIAKARSDSTTQIV